MNKRLTRSTTDVKLCGVCAGIAEYFGIDPTLVRIAYAVIMLFSAFVPCIVLYLLLSMIVPKA